MACLEMPRGTLNIVPLFCWCGEVALRYITFLPRLSRQVKDLQERLAVLARENEEKDKRVFKLEAELKEAQTRLRETERRLLHAESNQGQEAPKSKTCVIM